MSDQSQLVNYMLAAFESNYAPLTVFHLNEPEKIFLGEKEDRKCRFCGKGSPDTTFQNLSHAIPDFVGNKKLFAYYECDKCNSHFSKMLESHMANYMNFMHTLTQIRGKKKVPSFREFEGKSRIDIGTEEVKIQEFEDNPISEIDKENSQIKISAKRRGYVPIAVFKTLVKMALTIMPEEELGAFETTLTWINETDHRSSPHDLKELKILHTFAPGIQPLRFISCFLLRRKEQHIDNVPYMQFVLAYANFAFQIFLPLCVEDKKLFGKEMNLTFFPTPVEMEGTKVKRSILDMSNKETVKDDISSVKMTFERMEDSWDEEE